jgi:endonuclease YncB( thermonuclease family)
VGANCAEENKLALRARSAARRLVYGARKVSVRRVSGGDPSGRVFAHISVDGRDLGEALIQSGYARPRREAPAPWCDARGRLLPMR